MTIDPKLLEILACPVCRTAVTLETDQLLCATCGRRYPIRDGIPVMLVDEAQPATTNRSNQPASGRRDPSD